MPLEAERSGREEGSITLLALWSIAIIGVLLAAAIFTTRTELRIAQNIWAEAGVRYAAEAGTQLGLARLLRRRASGTAVFDGAPESWRDGSAQVEIGIVDESGKIDLNEAPLELLSGLLVAVGRPREEAMLLACNLLEWRGASAASCPEPIGETSRRPHGRFVVPEQLGDVPGFDDGLYRALSDSVTVVTRASGIDPLVAARPVLMAIPGATAAVVDSFLDARARWHDGGGLESGLGLQQALPFVMISPAREFTITATATTGAALYRADLTVRLTGIAAQPYQVLAVRTPPVRRAISASSRTGRVP